MSSLFKSSYSYEDSIGKCKYHPTYKVMRKPISNCTHCHALWVERLTSEVVGQTETASQWRNLALQFDRHRMQAIALIRLAASGEATQDDLAKFAAAPPMPGHAITEKLAELEDRIKLYEKVHKDDVYALDKLSEAESRYIKAEAQLEEANDRAFRASEAHVVTMGKLKEAEGVINSLTKFPTMLRKMWSGGEVQRWINAHIKPNSEELVTDSDRNPFYEGLFEGETEDERKSRLDHYNNPKGLIGYARKTELAPLLDERMPAGGYIHIGIDHPTLWAEDTAYAHLVPLFADQQSDVAKALNDLLMCPYVLEEATIPKAGISSAPDHQVVGTLHVSLTRHQRVRKVLKSYYHRMGEGSDKQNGEDNG